MVPRIFHPLRNKRAIQGNMKKKPSRPALDSRVAYEIFSDGSFEVRNYNQAPAYAGFLPGISGIWGIPMWAFFVNRGQGLCSFGVGDKDHAILEFLPANWAYSLAFSQGFRSFLKLTRKGDERFFEPFQLNPTPSEGITQNLKQSPYDLRLEEINQEVGLSIAVEYFHVPQEPLPVLVRTVRITNLLNQPCSLQMLDGLPVIAPYGIGNFMLKEMRYLASSYASVAEFAPDVPLFRSKTSTDDSAIVEGIDRSTFHFGYQARASTIPLRPVVDPDLIFGPSHDQRIPIRFLNRFKVPKLKDQNLENRLPCAFLYSSDSYGPGQTRTFHSFFGTTHQAMALQKFKTKARRHDYLDQKRSENRELVEGIGQMCATHSSHPIFDAYTRQNVLDNVLRGGKSMVFPARTDPIVLSLYSRKHGDLERDYNTFQLAPTYLSQGEGNFRDVLQNRRHDLFLNPKIDFEPIATFVNLIQADGYNPLVVKPKKIVCKSTPELRRTLSKIFNKSRLDRVMKYITQEFEPGAFFQFLELNRMSFKGSRQTLLGKLMLHAESTQPTNHGKDGGYWIDHWTYLLDLLDTYEELYPERTAELFFNKNIFTFCDSDTFVKPRNEKYVLWDGQPVQLESVQKDKTKTRMIEERSTLPFVVRANHGKGEIYRTTLMVKLLTLALNKLATIDSHGLGIEMEAERPGWNDALNGLPGQFGSSTCEVFELKRLLLKLQDHLKAAPASFSWITPKEVYVFFTGLHRLLVKTKPATDLRAHFIYWDRSSSLKESYRNAIRIGFSGEERVLPSVQVDSLIAAALSKLNSMLRRAKIRGTEFYHTYFWYEVTSFKRLKRKIDGVTCIQPTAFRKHTLPLYLEGQVHALRLETQPAKAQALIQGVKESALYDSVLKMYKVNACLDAENHKIGRARTFSRGWLENESIWLHMQYKYLLEILRSGHARTFFHELKTAGIPFLDPRTYGRSTTENSSFIVSSVHPDQSIVGKGFMARLSGATAEFIHIWRLMCVGERPFKLNAQGQVEARFAPVLPGWLFTHEERAFPYVDANNKARSYLAPRRSFSFIFLGHTVVSYQQGLRGPLKDTFGAHAATCRSFRITYNRGKVTELRQPTLPSSIASELREQKIRTIEIELS